MKLLGLNIDFSIKRLKSQRVQEQKSLSGVDARFGWWPRVLEPYAGAWQRNDEWTVDSVASYFAVYSCITLIAGDTGKLRPRLMVLDSNGINTETASAAFSPVLRRPNRFQNHIQFFEYWVISKLSRGNTYVLKERDQRGVVVALYILDPLRVQVLVGDDGSVYYKLNTDNINGLPEAVIVPASEIIHDRMNCLFHPLVGIPPIYASGLVANQGLNMQKDSSSFFKNSAMPGGVLSAPGTIDDVTAERLKVDWQSKFGGVNTGNVAVLGDGLTFQPMRATAVDSQLVEQMKLSALVVCSTYQVPPFKIGIEAIPAGQKVEDLNQIYYSDCLQKHIEQIELCLDEGLALPDKYSIEFDLDGLLRMDTATLYRTLGEGVKGSILKPNEARKKLNLKPVEGGNTIYLQQQNYSLEALSRRDAQPDPFAKDGVTEPASVEPHNDSQPSDDDVADQARMAALILEKELSLVEYS